MRGQNTLQPKSINKSNRGRSQELIQQRNRALIWRYFFYSEVKRLRYDDIITELSRDFFISEHTVLARLVEYSESIQNLITERPSLAKIEAENARFDITYTKAEKDKYTTQ